MTPGATSKDYLFITVSMDDLTNGIQCNAFSCPIARAVNRLLPIGYFAEATYDLRIFLNEGFSLVALGRMPSPVLQFIRAFDQGQWVSPMAFAIELRKVEHAT